MQTRSSALIRVFGVLAVVVVAAFAASLSMARVSRGGTPEAAASARAPVLRGLIDAEQAAHAERLAGAARVAQQLRDLRFKAGGRLSLASLPPALAQGVNAIVPISAEDNPPARPFVFHGSAADRAAAIGCLAQAVYYEAGFEPTAGAEAVAQVVLNRMRHPIFPHTVCGVVYQGADLKTGCQFSFTCDGALAHAPQPAAWARARRIAQRALAGSVMAGVGGATHYHAEWVVPWWRPTVTKVGQVGAHIFYRWPGGLGLPAAFNARYAGHERMMATPASPSLPVPVAAPMAPPALVLAKAGGDAEAVGLRRGPMTPIERLAALAAAAKREPDPAATAHPGTTEQATR